MSYLGFVLLENNGDHLAYYGHRLVVGDVDGVPAPHIVHAAESFDAGGFVILSACGGNGAYLCAAIGQTVLDYRNETICAQGLYVVSGPHAADDYSPYLTIISAHTRGDKQADFVLAEAIVRAGEEPELSIFMRDVNERISAAAFARAISLYGQLPDVPSSTIRYWRMIKGYVPTSFLVNSAVNVVVSGAPPKVLISAIELLNYANSLGVYDGRQQIVKLLYHSDWEVRATTVEALEGYAEAINDVVALARHDPVARVRIACVNFLGKFPDNEECRYALQRMSWADGDEAVRELASKVWKSALEEVRYA